ncbi:MAG: M20/M25/M40 family metallo-hydrolase [Pyrinomonadaceae bacterium]|nr:M20/M25/M40 family metallo-hydrolase [Pyrinomonadaceae bacterium]
MKKQLLLSILLLTLGLSVSAQKAAKQTKAGKNLRKHVSYLASDKLEGRRTGEKGATFAAGYVSNMFQRYKLKAGYTDSEGRKSFLQPFDYISRVEIGESTSFTLNGMSLERGKDWAPSVYSPSTTISEADVVFALHGISSKRLGHDDYAGVNASGKIVTVLSGVPGGMHPHSPFAAFNVPAKANIAKEKGASALVVISSSESLEKDRIAATAYNQSLGKTAVPVIVISREKGSSILGLKSSKELTAVEKWLDQKPENAIVRFSNIKPAKASATIEINPVKTEAYNVIGVLKGRDDQLKNEVIVIGAHYDHLGRGGRGSLAPNSKDIHNGADDNASGTSTLLELARQFAKEKRNRRTIVFIAFGGEEDGLIGSKAYVSNPVFPVKDTIAMFNMDMVGRLKDRKLTVGGIGTAGLWNDTVINSNRRVPNVYDKSKTIKKASFDASKEEVEMFQLQLNQDGFGPSDHSSFYAAKIPVLFFFTGTHTDYHKPTDDADKINYAGLEQIAGFVRDLVRVVDRRVSRPVYKVAKSSTPQGGRRRFNVTLGTIPSYGDNDNTGLVLDGVRDGSAAGKAGIKGGDKIVKIGEKEVKNISDYMFMLQEMKPGKEYDIVVIRGGERLTLKIVPDARK